MIAGVDSGNNRPMQPTADSQISGAGEAGRQKKRHSHLLNLIIFRAYTFKTTSFAIAIIPKRDKHFQQISGLVTYKNQNN